MSNYHYSKSKIIQQLTSSFDLVTALCSQTNETDYVLKENSKWSIKQNFEHLLLSASPVAKALNMPKITFIAFGKSAKGSRTYDQLIDSYKNMLNEGAVSTAKYSPLDNPLGLNRDELLKKWAKTLGYFEQNLDKWKEGELDKYRVPHPLLGKLTFREMLYFTNYHTLHHLKAMQQLLKI